MALKFYIKNITDKSLTLLHLDNLKIEPNEIKQISTEKYLANFSNLKRLGILSKIKFVSYADFLKANNVEETKTKETKVEETKTEETKTEETKTEETKTEETKTEETKTEETKKTQPKRRTRKTSNKEANPNNEE